ncbi:hypothetical protein [Glycomyces paridis]|uniref:WXG100 family type VII secretion target n=1 Tax=Glycomyces paridis TaxID=2126555 RepID=A0A4V4HPI8_9ACTN|nr:hypothetical protein [Glycomyces paridis]THV30136.1 hypothetical protein E9998_07100 [Glycomyces paridis]
MSDQWSEHGSDINAYKEDKPPESTTEAIKAFGTMPLFGGMLKGMYDNLQGINEGGGDEIFGGVVGAAASVADFGLKLADMTGKMGAAGQSPLSFLGANFIIDLLLAYIEPLDDLLKEVAGDAEEMQNQIDDWEMVKVALHELSGEVAEKAATALQSWGGAAANGASKSVAALCYTIDALSDQADVIQRGLAWAQALANLIYEVIKGILAALLEELLYAGAIALASSTFTFGGSIGAFIAWAVKGILRALLKALKKVFTTKGIYGVLLGALVAATAASARTLFGEGFDRGGNAGAVEANLDAGLAVDLEELTTAKASFVAQSGNAADISDKIKEIAGGEMTWGICGLFFAGSYNDNTATYEQDVQFVSITLADHGDKMQQVRDTYEGTDRTIHDDLHAVAEG